MLYGKWRPHGFAEVVGQDHIVTTLRNALSGGQVAHAYLFSGPRGTGKTTTARILARAINCRALKDGEPCGRCDACVAIDRGSALDLIEMDAASNRGIDDIRALREKIAFAPSDLGKKVYLLDEVHMLTDGAWNALLKTLEEPPPHAYFILATTELHEVPATVVSRCQRFDFSRFSTADIVGRLRVICEGEAYSVSDDGLGVIADAARGGMRDAITLLEQAVARIGPTPSADDIREALGLMKDERAKVLSEALTSRNLAECLGIVRDVADAGVDMGKFARATIEELRDELHDAAAGSGVDVRLLVRIITALSQADFRLDPGNPVPLEVACANAILEPETPGVPVVETMHPPEAAAPTRGAVPAARRRASTPAPAVAATDANEGHGQFLRELYARCSMVNISAAAWLNGTCEVVSLDDESLRLGFYWPMHMQKVDKDWRELVEQEAKNLLGHPVRLELELTERGLQKSKAGKSGGHLADMARELGATPVGKESN